MFKGLAKAHLQGQKSAIQSAAEVIFSLKILLRTSCLASLLSVYEGLACLPSRVIFFKRTHTTRNEKKKKNCCHSTLRSIVQSGLNITGATGGGGSTWRKIDLLVKGHPPPATRNLWRPARYLRNPARGIPGTDSWSPFRCTAKPGTSPFRTSPFPFLSTLYPLLVVPPTIISPFLHLSASPTRLLPLSLSLFTTKYPEPRLCPLQPVLARPFPWYPVVGPRVSPLQNVVPRRTSLCPVVPLWLAQPLLGRWEKLHRLPSPSLPSSSGAR